MHKVTVPFEREGSQGENHAESGSLRAHCRRCGACRRRVAGAAMQPGPSGHKQQNTHQAAPPRGHGRAGQRFLSEYDLNHDGKVTRAELDQALHQQFAAASKGSALSKDQFTAMQGSRAETTSARAFQRLDANHDGKLTLQEFSASQQKTFARMDRNGDGVITRDEMTSRRSYASRASNHT